MKISTALLSAAFVVAADAQRDVYRIGEHTASASVTGRTNSAAHVRPTSHTSRSGLALSNVAQMSDDGALYVAPSPNNDLGIAGDTSIFTVQFGGPSSLINKTYVHSDALFGIPLYGGSISGMLAFPDPPGLNASGCTGFSNPGVLAGKVAVIDRGGCFFTTKVLAAQQAGAVGAIIVDSDGLCNSDPACMNVCAACPYWSGVTGCTCDLPYMGDDGSGASVAIPSFMISRADGGSLRSTPSTTLLWATLQWNLVNPAGQVEWSLWTHASDEQARDLRLALEPYLPYLGHQVEFTPHWYIWDGRAIGCNTIANCTDQCVNGGYYCSVDPDNTFGYGVSGADVVLENLRQICVWQTAPAQWWNYVKAFDAVCNNINNFNPSCSYTQMSGVGVDVAAVKACVVTSNNTATGQGSNGWTNTLLQNEVDTRSQMVIVTLPTAVVEDTVLRGGVSTTTLLNAICSAMPSSVRPAVCGCLTVSSSSLSSCVNPVTDNRLPGWAVATIVCLTLAVVGGIGAGYFFYRRSRQEMREMMEDYRALVGEGGEAEQAELANNGAASRMASRLSQLTKTVLTPPPASNTGQEAAAAPAGSLNA